MRYVAAVLDDQGEGGQESGQPGPRDCAAWGPDAFSCLGTFASLPLARSACACSEHGPLRWWERPDGSWQAAGRGHLYRVFCGERLAEQGPVLEPMLEQVS